jgi:exopolyphosphatase/guanosine-5'-triphosphate,3'-diphosphate pyrophosphatase
MTLVVDSGGASTQVILGAGPTPTSMTSIPIGAGALTRDYIHHDPPKPREMRALQEHISEALSGLQDATPDAAVIIGGSADHLARFARRPKHLALTRVELDNALDALQNKPATDIAQKYKLPVERARLLPAGASILSAVLTRYQCREAQIKANGIRGGFVASYARDGAKWRARLIAR